MTREELLRRFPRAVESFIQRNLSADDTRPCPVVELVVSHAPLEAIQDKAPHTGRVLVRITSARKRLCDPDNLAVKWHLDFLRYVGAIQGDEPDKIELQVNQRKIKPGEAEHTEITVEAPNE